MMHITFLRLGAKQDAILRDHSVSANGKLADTVIFSILENEWPGVKEKLKDRKAS